MRITGYIGTLLAMLSFSTSCTFENDMSYPLLQGQIVAFAVEGQKSVNINAETQTVDVLLQETAEISALKVLEYAITDKTVAEGAPGNVIDLSEPKNVLLKTYPGQEYQWTISASQPIERYVKGNGIIDVVYDVKDMRALVYIVEKLPLEDLVIDDMKLGPETSKIISTSGHENATSGIVTRGVEFPMSLDCTLDRTFTVLYKGVEYVWTLTFIHKAVQNEVKSVNAWTYHAVVSGEFNGEGTPYYEYRASSDVEWTRWDEVSVDGVAVTADITGLSQETEYAVRLVSDNAVGVEYLFKTDSPAQLTGMGFDNWHAVAGKKGDTWYPYLAGDETPYWDTANPGISNFISCTTVPEYEHKVQGEAAAKMVSDLAVVKFAAGNIFTGRFASLVGTTAILEWGVPFTSRPYSLKGWYDYSPGIVDKYVDKANFPEMVGKPDIMQIRVALIAEGQGEDVGPMIVDSTKPGKPDFYKDPRVIAYAEILDNQDTGGEYIEFELPLVYNDDRTPAYAIIVASASSKGDYFTGAVGSTLYVDAFQFTYR